MTHKEYNGWWNYETWSVNLIIDNDEGLQEQAREMTKAHFDEDDEDKGAYSLSGELKEWVSDDLCPHSSEPTLEGQLLGAALSEVNWQEIAEHYVEDFAKEGK